MKPTLFYKDEHGFVLLKWFTKLGHRQSQISFHSTMITAPLSGSQPCPFNKLFTGTKKCISMNKLIYISYKLNVEAIPSLAYKPN